MEHSIAQTVKITQTLINEGWVFIDDGYNQISRAVNSSLSEDVSFKDNNEFAEWIFDFAE